MGFETPNFLPALPEIFLLGMVCLIMVIDLFLTERARVVTYLMSQATLAAAAVLSLGLWSEETTFTFNGSFILDPMAGLLKIAIYVAVFVVFLYSGKYLRDRGMYKGEFFTLGLFGVLGMMVMVSAHSLLTVYLGLELLSLALYAMVAMQRDSVRASEAAMKYFVLGAMASAMLLYGMSMIYGLTGSLDLTEIRAAIGEGRAQGMVMVFGLVFIMVGLAFKLGAVPFHMWVPDVYHGAPTAVTLYISTAPKLAAFAMLMRLLVDGLAGLEGQWQDIVILLSVASIVIGNLVAIAQTNIKRMLAYSGISHMGFLLLGILSGSQLGLQAAMFYALVYVIMGLGGFGMVILMSRAGFEAEELDDFKGLNEKNPWYALIMLILMFSMAGVPPFLGFWAKLDVIRAVVQAELYWLAAVAVVFSVIGAFYYLRIIKLMYFDKPVRRVPLEAPFDMRLVLSANGLAVLALGLYPAWLTGLVSISLGGG